VLVTDTVHPTTEPGEDTVWTEGVSDTEKSARCGTMVTVFPVLDKAVPQAFSKCIIAVAVTGVVTLHRLPSAMSATSSVCEALPHTSNTVPRSHVMEEASQEDGAGPLTMLA
jgi:hypothetical protein